jgi:MoxR-like ATPase
MAFTSFQRKAPDKLDAVELESGPDRIRGAHYRASSALENAVNVAIALGRPLLVSGEPGCGKTELGFSIARKLGIFRLHFYSVKSDSEPRSLFYEYDTIGRFHAAQIGRGFAAAKTDGPDNVKASEFIEYRALGRAILDAHDPAEIRHLIAGRYIHPGQPQRSVVLVDEIDKAPRDFPNDLLNEIDQFWFRVPELGFETGGRAPETPKNISAEVRPIVLITTNTERQLPDAFLRRCVYHHIAFPDWETLRIIVDARLASLAGQLAVKDANSVETERDVNRAFWLMEQARQSTLEKPPGTAELLDFVEVVRKRRLERSDETWNDRFASCIHALAKTEHDLQIVNSFLKAGSNPSSNE